MRLEAKLVLVFLVGLCLGTSAASAQDDDLMAGDRAPGDVSDDELWERPPVEEEAPPPPEKKAPKEMMPPDGRALQVGLGLVYGLETAAKPMQGVNSYGLGFALRGAYTLDFGLSVGIASAFYLGDTVEAGYVAGAALEGSTVNSFTFGGEAGYDLWFGKFMLRPSVELGFILTFSSRDSATDGGRTWFSPYFAPGLTGLYMITEMIYIAGDFRLPLAISDADSTMTLTVTGGLRF